MERYPLTQSVFDGIGSWAKCAFVNPDGTGYVSELYPVCTPAGCWTVPVGGKLQAVGSNFETTNWETSVIWRDWKEDARSLCPALAVGDVVEARHKDGLYSLYLVTPNLGFYRIGRGLERGVVLCELCTSLDAEITEIHSPVSLRRDFSIIELRNIVEGDKQFLLWKKPEVKEMTVEEISKALGCTVKVVGNDNR